MARQLQPLGIARGGRHLVQLSDQIICPQQGRVDDDPRGRFPLLRVQHRPGPRTDPFGHRRDREIPAQPGQLEIRPETLERRLYHVRRRVRELIFGGHCYLKEYMSLFYAFKSTFELILARAWISAPIRAMMENGRRLHSQEAIRGDGPDPRGWDEARACGAVHAPSDGVSVHGERAAQPGVAGEAGPCAAALPDRRFRPRLLLARARGLPGFPAAGDAAGMVDGQDRRQPRPRRPGRGRASRDGLARDHDLGLCVEDGGVTGLAGGAVAGVVGVSGTKDATRSTESFQRENRAFFPTAICSGPSPRVKP